jgi:hypothetical protein
MKDFLRRSFGTDQPTKMVGTVIQNFSPGWYTISDSTGRVYRVESIENYVPGQTVSVQLGRIVCKVVLNKTPKIYEV